MATGLVICPQCEQRGAEPYQVRYEKGYKTSPFAVDGAAMTGRPVRQEISRLHLIGSKAAPI